MLRVDTTNSTYEIDTRDKRIRRMSSKGNWKADRIGGNHVWKPYHRLNKAIGCYQIQWREDGDVGLTARVVSEKLVKVS